MLGGDVRRRLAKLKRGHVVSCVVLMCGVVEFGEQITLKRAEIEVLPFMQCRNRSKKVVASRTRDA